ncbi:hypothetical protein ACFWQG_06455 [Rhodococcus sp. NPDC058532]|uniref:hypothetical protein n=1 Tax=Rhodococcus sp. NPDC058532 TaxID=3346540 RepID=UPI00364FA980
MNDSAEWSSLAEDADSGRLLLDRGAAARCAVHCAEFVNHLVALREKAYSLGRLDGFGTFPSGIALATKFSRKAVGGDYSMVQALTDHIAEVEAMREVFERIEARYAAAEQRGEERFAAIDPGR